MTSPNPLPREIAHGVFWLGGCLHNAYQGKIYHSYQSAYLVRGESSSLLVETGHPKDLPVFEAQLASILSDGQAPLKYIFATHQETPHAAGLGSWMRKYPDALACGDIRDYHLIFPDFVGRYLPLKSGETVDLGGTEFIVIDAIIKDLNSTQWGFDRSRRILFPGDGFAYGHYHEAGQCGKLAEEVPTLAISDMTALFAELALYWTRFTDMEPYIRRLSECIAELNVTMIAPIHGLPITDLDRTLPKVMEGLRLGSTGATVNFADD